MYFTSELPQHFRLINFYLILLVSYGCCRAPVKLSDFFVVVVVDGADQNLESFGNSLIAMENMDRSSPEMWPEKGKHLGAIC